MALRSNNQIKIEGGMASMTDLVFLLLIFFMVIAIMSKDATPLDLPNPDTDLNPIVDNAQTTVAITEDNRYVIFPGGDINNPMDFDELKEQVGPAVFGSGNPSLKIAGHKNADYEAIFQVLALCQANSWDPILAYDK